MLKQKNSKKQGDVGLGLAIAYFTGKGYTVCIPLTDNQSYDLLIDDGSLKRVQVKTTTEKNKYGFYQVELRTLGGNQSFHIIKKFDPHNYDLLFVVDGNGFQYLIPVEMIKARSRLSIGKQIQKFFKI